MPIPTGEHADWRETSDKVSQCGYAAMCVLFHRSLTDPTFPYGIKDIIELEMLVLEALNFSVLVFQPFRWLTIYARASFSDLIFDDAWYVLCVCRVLLAGEY